MYRVATLLACTLLAACGGKVAKPLPVPRIEVVETKVTVPVPCPALAALGPEPTYPDTDEAIAAASTVGQLSKLYVKGRLLRAQRLAEYAVARAACTF